MEFKMTKKECGQLAVEKVLEITKRKLQERIEKYNLNPKLCNHCKTVIDYQHRRNTFCTQSCAAKQNNLNVRRHGKAPVFCTCGKKLKTLLENSLCVECKKEQYINGIKETGIAPSEYGGKKYLLLTQGANCKICGLEDWMGQPVPLVLDHIDGNAEDNSITNLRLICCNCDAQTPTYKGLNKGNGRRQRRQFYKGKEYNSPRVG